MRGDLSELVELLAAPIHHSSAQHPALVYSVHCSNTLFTYDCHMCVFVHLYIWLCPLPIHHSSTPQCALAVYRVYILHCVCIVNMCVCVGGEVLGDQEIFSRHPSAALFVLPVHCIQCGAIVTFTKNSVKSNNIALILQRSLCIMLC